jgi:predicted HTH transcriptional regulator
MTGDDREQVAGEQITSLVNRPESASLAFEPALGDPDQAAVLIAAVANSGGGDIIFGVAEPGNLVGLDDPAAATRVVKQAAGEVVPAVAVSVKDEEVDGQTVTVVKVPGGIGPVLSAKGGLVKRDSAGQPEAVSEADVRQAIARSGKTGDDAIAELTKVVAELSAYILAADKRSTRADDDLSKAVKKGQTIRAQLPAIFVSGVFGALVGFALTAVLGS